MEPSISIYSFSLYTALPLMLFFGFYFLFAKTPEKKIFKNYLRSRQIMGIAMLLLSANYSVHFFFGIRFKNADSAILMNMSTYFLCYSLFSSAAAVPPSEAPVSASGRLLLYQYKVSVRHTPNR